MGMAGSISCLGSSVRRVEVVDRVRATGGEPKFHELEPDKEVAERDRRPAGSRMTPLRPTAVMTMRR